MSTDPGDSGRGGAVRLNAMSQLLLAVAAIGATVSAIASTVLSYRDYKDRQAAKPRIILEALPGGLEYTGSKDTYELSGTVVNTGDKIARGCKAIYQDVNDNFMPRRYLTTVLERGPYWNLNPGGNHTSRGKISLRKPTTNRIISLSKFGSSAEPIEYIPLHSFMEFIFEGI